MSSLTIHALDSGLDVRLTQEARRARKSKNALVKELLARALGLPVQGELADDYREFCGLWSSGELADFQAGQAGNAAVDPADWV